MHANDPFLLTVADLAHSETEERWFSIGRELTARCSRAYCGLKLSPPRKCKSSRLVAQRRWKFVNMKRVYENYGLLTDPDYPVSVRSSKLATQLFTSDKAPIELRAKARRVLNKKQESNGLVAPLPDAPATQASTPEEITLIPMGCVRLRSSAFPLLH
jgi:hypothetical protein